MDEKFKMDGALKAFEMLAALPELPSSIEALNAKIDALRADIRARHPQQGEGGDCWLDAKKAAQYLDISPGSFDKYRYKTTPRIKGYNLDGKTLYKKSDLDLFVKLYEVKASLN